MARIIAHRRGYVDLHDEAKPFVTRAALNFAVPTPEPSQVCGTVWTGEVGGAYLVRLL